MRNRLFILGATLLVYMAAFAQAKSSHSSAGAQSAPQSAITARETGSGMATGKTASVASSPSDEVKAPRDIATGQASGKRQHKPVTLSTGTDVSISAQAPNGTHHLDEKNIVHRDLAAREAGSGMATGKREVGSGMATGKRDSRKQNAISYNEEVKSPRDSATGQASGKRNGGMSNITNNPLYKDSGTSGVNPLYQGSDKRVQSGVSSPAGAPASGAAVIKTKTKSNQSNDRMVGGGDLDGDGSPDVSSAAAVKATKSRSNIQNNRVAAGDVNGDGVEATRVKSKSNITNNRVDNAQGSSGFVAGDAKISKADAGVADSQKTTKKSDPYGNITWQSTGTGSSDAKPAAMRHADPKRERPEPAQPMPPQSGKH